MKNFQRASARSTPPLRRLPPAPHAVEFLRHLPRHYLLLPSTFPAKPPCRRRPHTAPFPATLIGQPRPSSHREPLAFAPSATPRRPHCQTPRDIHAPSAARRPRAGLRSSPSPPPRLYHRPLHPLHPASPAPCPSAIGKTAAAKKKLPGRTASLPASGTGFEPVLPA